MASPHCAQCAVYEKRVMTKAPGDALPADVVPCKDFVMSDAFREWAVGEMRREVMGQVSKAGLDRMALVRAKPTEAVPDDEGPGEGEDPGEGDGGRP